MKRALVLTTESARHPFRMWVAPSPLKPEPKPKPVTDLAFFLVSFISCFIIIFGLIF
ncbi:MAG: hypothetical protein ACKVOJ_03685 [Sphingomonadaceae bacterium]